MPLYRVEWVIEIAAHSPQEAATQAREIHLDPNSTATLFEVREFDSDICVPVDVAENCSE